MWDRRNFVDLTACQIKVLVERNRFKTEGIWFILYFILELQ